MITYDLGDIVGPGDEGVSDHIKDKRPEVGDRTKLFVEEEQETSVSSER
jgi:hypothetical protein